MTKNDQQLRIRTDKKNIFAEMRKVALESNSRFKNAYSNHVVGERRYSKRQNNEEKSCAWKCQELGIRHFCRHSVAEVWWETDIPRMFKEHLCKFQVLFQRFVYCRLSWSVWKAIPYKNIFGPANSLYKRVINVEGHIWNNCRCKKSTKIPDFCILAF